MKIYQKEFTQWLPTSLPEAWKFFSDPRNLKRITPSEMDFSIRTENLSPDIYEGKLIDYRVSPLQGYRTSWVTRILAVEKEKYFIDWSNLNKLSSGLMRTKRIPDETIIKAWKKHATLNPTKE